MEGDFFSWYINKEQWNAQIAKTITDIYGILGKFSNSPTMSVGSKCQDFFKELYQTMVPAAVRHSLGEYYTKKWLAKNVIEEVEGELPERWKSIDPCCGSGTFLTVLIEKVLHEEESLKNSEKTLAVLNRVKGIDLNPIAVMTARVNYFINISHIIEDGDNLEIPVYLGDASNVPQKIRVDNVDCLEYTISTIKEPIRIIVPVSMVRDSGLFSVVMSQIEFDIKALDIDAVYQKLVGLCDNCDKTKLILSNLKNLANQLVELERQQWNGVWARIITNFLTTANLGKFDLVVGNPPWVDWKSLPSGYRDKIKSLCISRHLFSGDGITGGINLNICALITNVAAQNWLAPNGTMALLMPEPLIFQQSYEGFRNLITDNGDRLYFNSFTNWNNAGHPFKPVTQKFLTFYIGTQKMNYAEGVPVKYYKKKRGMLIDDQEEINMTDVFEKESGLLGMCHQNKNFFSYAKNKKTLKEYSLIAGESEYIGREGIEFYPQELIVFQLSGLPSGKGLTALQNMQNEKSKYKIPLRRVLLETEFLHPMIKGKDIVPFHANISDYIVPFPYEKENPQIPIDLKRLRTLAPRLASYYMQNKEVMEAQTGYSDRIIGKSRAEFYALARVGAYSYQKYYVVMRDNSNWAAAVVTDVETSWGGRKRPVFQNHAISICEDSQGNFIGLDEAYYICGILNSKIVVQFMMTSSDSRSFPIRPRVRIPKYNPDDKKHVEIARLSKKAHENYNNKGKIEQITDAINSLYLSLLNEIK